MRGRTLRLPTEPWRRNQYAVLIAVFVSFLGFSFVIPFLPLYIRELGVQDVGQAALMAGLTFGVAPLFSGLLAPLWGSLADRHGVKLMVQRALISFAILNFLMSLVVDPWQLLALRCGIGLFGGFGPMTASLVTRGAPRSEVGAAIGKLQATQIAATAIGPLLGGVVADTLGIRVSFVVTAALCLASFVLITRLYREEPATTGARGAAGRLPMRRVLLLPGFLPLVTVLLLSQLVDRSFGPILPLLVHELDPTVPLASTAGALFTIGSLVSALAASQIGRLSSRYGPRWLLPGSLAIGLAAVAPLILVSAIWELAALRALFGLAAGTTATLAYAAATRVVPDESRSTAFGFLGSANSLATAAGPFGAGALSTSSFRLAFGVDAALYAAALALALALAIRASGEASGGSTGRESGPTRA